MQTISINAASEGLPDIDIARRIAAGNLDALRMLMRRYNQTLYRTARSILKDDAEAEDAVQEAHFLAYRAMARFRGEAKLATWLVRIVINEALGRVRKHKRRAEVIDMNGDTAQYGEATEANMDEISPEQPDHAALRAETRRLLDARIEQLPDVFRTVFVLRALEEMSVEEVAACLDIPPATVRTRYFRARGLLREALAREIDFSLVEAFSFAGARCDRIVSGVLEQLKNLQARGA